MSPASLQPFEMHLLPVAGEQDSGLTSIKRGTCRSAGITHDTAAVAAIDMPRAVRAFPAAAR